jgi:hypothetical protein
MCPPENFSVARADASKIEANGDANIGDANIKASCSVTPSPDPSPGLGPDPSPAPSNDKRKDSRNS